jgi:hypothetical protein
MMKHRCNVLLGSSSRKRHGSRTITVADDSDSDALNLFVGETSPRVFENAT